MTKLITIHMMALNTPREEWHKEPFPCGRGNHSHMPFFCIKGGGTANVINIDAIQKLQLPKEPHRSHI